MNAHFPRKYRIFRENVDFPQILLRLPQKISKTENGVSHFHPFFTSCLTHPLLEHNHIVEDNFTFVERDNKKHVEKSKMQTVEIKTGLQKLEWKEPRKAEKNFA